MRVNATRTDHHTQSAQQPPKEHTYNAATHRTLTCASGLHNPCWLHAHTHTHTYTTEPSGKRRYTHTHTHTQTRMHTHPVGYPQCEQALAVNTNTQQHAHTQAHANVRTYTDVWVAGAPTPANSHTHRVCQQAALDFSCGLNARDELQHHLLHQAAYQRQLPIKPAPAHAEAPVDMTPSNSSATFSTRPRTSASSPSNLRSRWDRRAGTTCANKHHLPAADATAWMAGG